MSKNEVLLNTSYHDLIRGKKMNKEQRSIIFGACSASNLSEVQLNKIARGDFDAKQMKALLKLYNSKVNIFDKYRKQYVALEQNQYDGDEMNIIVDAIIGEIPVEFLQLIMDARDSSYMYEIMDSFNLGIPYELVVQYANDESLIKVRCTKEVLSIIRDSNIFEFNNLEEDMYMIVCKAMMLGVSDNDIKYALSITDNELCVDTILSGSVDGLTPHELELLVNKQDSYLKMTALIECYKEYYCDTFCSFLKETSNEMYDYINILNDDFVAYMLELNEKFIKSEELVYKVESTELEHKKEEAINEYKDYCLKSLCELRWEHDFDSVKLMLLGNNYIQEIIDDFKGEASFKSYYFSVISNRVLYREYTKLQEINFDELLKDILILDHGTLMDNFQEIGEKLYLYSNFDQIADDLVSLTDDNEAIQIFTNKQKDVFIYVKFNKDSYSLEKIEIQMMDEKLLFDGRSVEYFMKEKNRLNLHNKEVVESTKRISVERSK